MIATSHNPLDYGWWIGARSAGVIAIVLVSAAVSLGLAQAARESRRPGMAVVLRQLHQYIAVGALAAIAVHGVLLLGDSWLQANVINLLVPFTLDYRPLYTGLGVIAAWAVALLGLSYWARARIGQKRWKVIHRFTLLAYVMAVIHSLGAGTDGSSAWLRVVVLLAAAPIPYLLVLRLWPARSKRRPPTRAAAPG